MVIKAYAKNIFKKESVFLIISMVITLVITLLSAHYKWGFESAFILAIGLFTILTMFAFITSDSFIKKLLLFGIVAGITQLIADKWLVEDIDGYADQLMSLKRKNLRI